MYIFYFSRIRTHSCNELPHSTLNYLDITIVKQGVMRYSINGEDAVLSAGDAIVFFPGDTRERYLGGTAEYLSFNAEITSNDKLPQFNGVVKDCLNEEVSILIKLYEESRCSNSECADQKCEQYLSLLYLSLYEKSRAPIRNHYVTSMKQYISEHLGETITLQQLSRAVYLSPNYCNRIFRTHTGMSLSTYIIRERMEEAMRRIIHGDSMSDIASDLGYKDYCYFSRQFKKTVGKSPTEFRHSYTEEETAAQWHGTLLQDKEDTRA